MSDDPMSLVKPVTSMAPEDIAVTVKEVKTLEGEPEGLTMGSPEPPDPAAGEPGGPTGDGFASQDPLLQDPRMAMPEDPAAGEDMPAQMAVAQSPVDQGADAATEPDPKAPDSASQAAAPAASAWETLAPEPPVTSSGEPLEPASASASDMEAAVQDPAAVSSDPSDLADAETPAPEPAADQAAEARLDDDSAAAAAATLASTTSEIIYHEGDAPSETPEAAAGKKDEPETRDEASRPDPEKGETARDAAQETMADGQRREKTLEDNLRDMLRPMIKEWLDANMPRILESAVKEELSRTGDGKGEAS